MKVVEHQPPQFVSVPDGDPSLFPIGPIQGAPDWQRLAINRIREELEAPVSKRISDSLRRYTGESVLHAFNPRFEGPFDHTKEQQIRWRRRNLERARDFGIVVIWFAAKDNSVSYLPSTLYEDSSGIEYGSVFGWYNYNKSVNIHLGIDPEYQGGNEDYLRLVADEYGLPVHKDLGSLCAAASNRVKEIVRQSQIP